MDYKTKPTSREDLRRYSKLFRKLFDVPLTGPFPVLQALDRVSDIFSGCNYTVVEDKHLPPQTMARCVPNDVAEEVYRVLGQYNDSRNEEGSEGEQF